MENIVKYNQVPVISKETLISYLDLSGVGKNISDKEKSMFLEISVLNGLNPFKREIYIVAYGEGEKRNVSIITGYEVYIRRAEESGLLNGWHVETFGTGNEMTAKLTVYRKDFAQPFTHEVEFIEYAQKNYKGELNKFWKDKPKTMLKKVAISQGFRMCFNQILGGMPYTNDEIDTIDINHEIIEPAKPLPEKKTKLTDKAFKSLIEKLETAPENVKENLSKLELTEVQKNDFQTKVFELAKESKLSVYFDMLPVELQEIITLKFSTNE